MRQSSCHGLPSARVGAREAAARRKDPARLRDGSQHGANPTGPQHHVFFFFFLKKFFPSKHGAPILKLKQKRFWRALLCSARHEFRGRWAPPETSRESLRSPRLLTAGSGQGARLLVPALPCSRSPACSHPQTCPPRLLLLSTPTSTPLPLGWGLQEGEWGDSPRSAPQPCGVTLAISAATEPTWTSRCPPHLATSLCHGPGKWRATRPALTEHLSQALPLDRPKPSPSHSL